MTNLVRTLLLVSVAMASPSVAQTQQPPATAVAEKSARGSSFLPASFNAPTLVETARFKLVPLGPELTQVDYAAYMSSIEHLQKTFSRSTTWPRKGISHADAMRDMEAEQARFKSRKSFAYAVLTPDGSHELGCVYVAPSITEEYDAVVRMWVTKAQYDAGFDAELYKWVTNWMQSDWPFKRVAYPGRSIDWKSWDAMVAASAPRKVTPGENSRKS